MEAPSVLKICEDNKIDLSEVAYIGDDVNYLNF